MFFISCTKCTVDNRLPSYQLHAYAAAITLMLFGTSCPKKLSDHT